MRRLSVLLVVLFVLGWASVARAQVKLDGRWKQGALREDFTVQTWLNAGCGPPPSSSSTGGGEIVDVRTEGDELVFVGGGRVYRTNACYDPMPNLQRGAHSRDASGRSWRTRCSTAPNDPRSAVLNTYVNASTDTHIDLVETGRYEITLEGGKCVADIKRTRTFDKLPDDSTPAAASVSASAAPAPIPTPAKTNDAPRSALCGIVGDPTKLEVRPSRKVMRPGETFHFNGVVLDAKGCDTKTVTTWRVAGGTGVKVDNFGNVTAAPDATEGTLDIVATAAGRDAHVAVEIVSAAGYDALLAKEGLNAEGANDEASSTTIATASIGAGDTSVEDHSKQRKLTFLAIIGGLLAVLVVAGIVVLRRGRKAKALVQEAEVRHKERVSEVLERRKMREQEHAAQMRAHEDSVRAHNRALAEPPISAPVISTAAPSSLPTPRSQRAELVCASCGREMEAGTSFCPHDGTPLVAASKKQATGGGICPVCNTVYGAEVTLCPKDKAALIPYPVTASAPSRVPMRGKICPQCGDRFDGAADFCGKDGTQLVLLN